MTSPLPTQPNREKLIHEALNAIKRHKHKYSGIERKRLENRQKELEKFLCDIFEV